MSDRIETFTVGDRAHLELRTNSGEITVTPGPAKRVDVRLEGGAADAFRVEQRGDVVVVAPERGGLRRFSAVDVHVVVPPGATASLATGSGDVLVQAPLAELNVVAASGDLRIHAAVGQARVKTASGDVFVDEVASRLEAATASGSVRVGTVGRHLTVSCASGDIHVGQVGETADLRTASGTVIIDRFDGTDVAVRTMTGDVRLGIPPRRRLEVDLQTLSGDLRNRLPQGDGSPPDRTVAIRISSVSGDVTLQGA